MVQRNANKQELIRSFVVCVFCQLLVAAWFTVVCVMAYGIFYGLPAIGNSSLLSFSGTRALNHLASLDYPHPKLYREKGSFGLLRAQQYLYEQMILIKGNNTPWMHVVRENDDYDNTDYNVYALLEGISGKPSPTRNTFLINAHYDSQYMTPGAQDNGCGVVTVLETLRAVVQSGQPSVSAYFLFNDNEEAGFVGIRAFLDVHAPEIGAFLNFDGREGVKSTVFRTTSSYLDKIYAAHALHPFGSAIVDDVIHNAALTDFYELAGISGNYPAIPGFDIGYIDAPQTYHTSQDCVSHVTAEMLQHQGDNVLPFMLAVLNLPALPQSDPSPPALVHRTVYFDVFGLSMVIYPRYASILIHVGFLVCTIGFLVLFSRTNSTRFVATLATSLLVLLAVLVGLVTGIAIGLLANVINDHFYQGSSGTSVGVGLVSTANVLGTLSSLNLFMYIRRCCAKNSNVVDEPHMWQSTLIVLTLLLFVGCILAPFLSGSYLILPIAFLMLIALFARFILDRVAPKRFPLFNSTLPQNKIAPSEMQAENTLLLEQRDEELVEVHSTNAAVSSVSITTWSVLLLRFFTLVVATCGATLVVYNLISGVGSLSAFPELDGILEPLVFMAIISLFVSLVIIPAIPFVVLELGMVAVIFCLCCVVALMIPACALFPHNSPYRPIRVYAVEDFALSRFTIRPAKALEFDAMRDQLLRVPYFASMKCQDFSCTVPSVQSPLSGFNVTNARNGNTINLNLHPPPNIRSARLQINGRVANVTLDGVVQHVVWAASFGLYYGLQDHVTSFSFVIVGDVVDVTLTPYLEYSYSAGMESLMCNQGVNLMMDSYYSEFVNYVSQTSSYRRE